nr:hypothetical protein [uncultured Anaerostipes sp.]
MAADSAGQIGLDLVINQQQFNKQLGGIQNLAKKTGKMLAGAFAVKGLTSFAKDCIELGSNLTEVQNVVDVVFPTMNKKVNEFAQNAASTFGLSETMAKKFTGTFGAMANAFGFSEKESYKMSTALTGLAGDVASFYNISQDEAFTKLKSVFSGETETLKDLGIVMTQTALDQYALANGFGKTTSAMTEQEKVALRYAFVQQQLQNATGDFSRTSDQWANQIRILSLQFDSLKASIGQGLINLFLPIVKVINLVLGKLMTLANAFKSFTAMIMGKKTSGASASLDKTATSAGKVSNSLNNATSSANKLNKSTKKVGDTAKKTAKKISGLMGFDQINKLTETKGSSGSKSSTPSSGTGSAAGGASGGNVDMGSLPEGEDEKATKLGKGYDNLRKAIDKLRVAFSAFSKVAIGAFKWIWKNMLVPLGKWTMQKLAPKLIELLAAALNVLTAVCKALQPLWQWAWDHLFKPLANFVGDAIIGFLDLLVKGLNGLANWINKHQGAVQNITIALVSFFTAFKLVSFVTKFIGPISNAISGIKMFGKGIISFKTLFSGLFPKLFGVAGKAVALLTSPLGIAIVVVGALITAGVLLWKNWDKIKKSKFAKFLSGIVTSFKNLLKWVKKNVHPIKAFKKLWEGIKNKKAKLEAEVKEKVKGALASLKEGWESVKDKAASLVAEAKEKAEGAIANLKEGWDSIKDRATTLVAEAKEKAQGTLEKLHNAWENIKDRGAELIATAKEKAEGAIDKLKSGWESIKDRGAELIAEAKEKASGVIAKLKGAWDSVKDKTATLIGQAENKAGKGLTSIKNAFKTVKDKTATLKAYAKNKATSAISKIRKGWNSLKSKTVTLTARVKTAVDSVKSWVNKHVIDKLNGALSKAKVFGKNPIPHLASGGYVKKNTPQLAMIGDNRHQGEVVAPEDKMIAMAKKAAELSGGSSKDDQIIRLLMELINAVKSIDTDVYLDGKKITKTVNDNNNADIRAGKRPILI